MHVVKCSIMTGHDRFFFFFHPTQLPRRHRRRYVCYGCLCGGMVLLGIVFCIFIDAKLGKCAKVFTFKKMLTLGVLELITRFLTSQMLTICSDCDTCSRFRPHSGRKRHRERARVVSIISSHKANSSDLRTLTRSALILG